MRYAPEHKEGTRARLVKATGALAKRQGFSGTGIDGLMAAAGLTSGAFYAHFRSKNELLEAIVDNELQRSVALFAQQSPAKAMKVIEGYLSPAHVAHPESGCAVPALAPEIAAAAGIHPPALLIIGEVVSLAGRLAWFAGAAASGSLTA